MTLLIRRAKSGDRDAANELLAACIPRLVEIARRFGVARNVSSAGGSDFVASATASFWTALIEGRLQALQNRDNLWPLLVRMAKQEACSYARAENAAKRGGGAIRSLSAIPPESIEAANLLRDDTPATIRHHRSQADADTMLPPSQELIAEMERICGDFLELLPDGLQEIAVFKLLGCRNDEIATYCDCAERTVERKLRVIRTCWVDNMS